MKRIVVVGSLNHDVVFTAKKFPEPGETVMGEALQTFCGGKGANQAFAAAKLGAEVIMLGQVGNDAAGEAQIANLNGAGVRTNWIARDNAKPTGTAIIGIDAQHENRIIVIPGANGTFTPEILESTADVFSGAGFVLLQLEIPMPTVENAARLAKKAGAIVILDPAPAAPLSAQLLANCDYLTPNLTELAALTRQPLNEHSSTEQIAAAARQLCVRGVTQVIAKLGRRGAMLVTRESATSWPAFKVDAVDTTAAGDAFNGAFAAQLAAGANESDAAIFASAAAAISVTRAGAQAAMPTRDEVEAFIRSNKH